MEQIRRIITGIDFSLCSLNALEYAAGLSQSLNASLVVIHAYHATSGAGSLTSTERHIRKSVREELRASVRPIRNRYPDVKIKEVIKRADAMDALHWSIKKYRGDLVVVGTRGVHESEDIFIGSTTGSLIKLADAPVFAIPGHFKYRPYRRVLFAVKHPFVASQHVLNPFLILMDHFKPTVDLLYVTRDSTPDLSRFPNPYPIAPHTHEMHTSDSDNIYHSIQEYLKHHSSDLLVVISRLRGFFEGLFAQSSTSASSFNSELPILVLHGAVRE